LNPQLLIILSLIEANSDAFSDLVCRRASVFSSVLASEWVEDDSSALALTYYFVAALAFVAVFCFV